MKLTNEQQSDVDQELLSRRAVEHEETWEEEQIRNLLETCTALEAERDEAKAQTAAMLEKAAYRAEHHSFNLANEIRALIPADYAAVLAEHDQATRDHAYKCGFEDGAALKGLERIVAQRTQSFVDQLKQDCLAMSKAEERILILEADVLNAYEESAIIAYKAYSRSNSGDVKFWAESASNEIRMLAAHRAAAGASEEKK